MANLPVPSDLGEWHISLEQTVPQGISYQAVIAGIARPVTLLKGPMQLDDWAREGVTQASKGLADFFGEEPLTPLNLQSFPGERGAVAKGHYPFPFKVHAIAEGELLRSGIPFSGAASVHIGFCRRPRSRTAVIMRWRACQMDVDWLGFAKYGLDSAHLDRLWVFMDGPKLYFEINPQVSVIPIIEQQGKRPIHHDPIMLAVYNSLE